MASDQERNMKMKTKIIISQCGMQQRVCNFYQKEIAAALTVHINVLLVLEFQNRNYSLVCKGKSPEVPFHGITSPYSYFEVI